MAIASLLAGACGGPSVPTNQPSGQPTSGLASGPATPTPRPSGEWGNLELPAAQPVASIEPTKSGDAGIATDTAFKLTSLDGESVVDLAKRVEVTPAVDLRAGDATGDSILLHPTDPLHPGRAYRLTLRRADGSIARTWTMTAADALHIIGMIPDDQSTNVPLDTGIEFTFDQDGVTAGGLQAHLAIEPTITGHVEVHGRRGAYVPDKPLEPGTLYSVTVKAGLPLPGTEQVLDHDMVFQFETLDANAAKVDRLSEVTRLVDSPTSQAPAIPLGFADTNGDDVTTVPKWMPIKVHRIDTVAGATAAYTKLVRAPDWAITGGAPVDTSSLTQVVATDVPVHAIGGESEGSAWLQLPARLPAGWYVLTMTVGQSPQQALIQVTDMASYAMVTTTRTVTWVNDLATGRPVSGATVEAGGSSLGRTDSNGVRLAKTPDALLALPGDVPSVVIVRHGDRAMFVPLGSGGCGKCDSGYNAIDGSGASAGDPDLWWHALEVERGQLRTTDQANIWGVVRSRSDGSVPKDVTVRMITAGSDSDAPAVAETTASPDANGVFLADLAFKDVPFGGYEIELMAGSTRLGSSYVDVGPLVKPAYQIEVTTNKHAILSGAPVRATADATFFDGTPVAGVQLGVATGYDAGDGESPPPAGQKAVTGVDGSAAATVRPRLPSSRSDPSQWSWLNVVAAPRRPEEADINGEAWLAVFRSDSLVTSDGQVKGSTLRVTGTVDAVDFAKAARATPQDYELDPSGAPRAGARVTLRITRVTDVRTRVGNGYDFITKRTTPIYTYDTKQQVIRTVTVRTGSDGTYRYSMNVGPSTAGYTIRATYTDGAGRTVFDEADASRDELNPETSEFGLINARGEAVGEYAVGDTVSVRARGGSTKPSLDRYLFLTLHRGLQATKVQPGPDFRTTFRAGWVPDASISAVRFNGAGYDVATSAYWAYLDTRGRTLKVTLSPDSTRYAPGGTAHLAIRVTDAKGQPVAASVVVRVIDEKLYAIGAAQDVNLMSDVYTAISDGFLVEGWSHQNPVGGGDGGGDTTGGGGEGRSAFRDWLLFRQVTTGADGRAVVDVPLSDDLTSWRAMAAAVDGKLNVGSTSARLAVGLPFFVDATLAPTYLVGETPILRVRSFGADLRPGATVSFQVSSTTLGVAPQTVTAPAFEAATVALPALTEGTHEIRIAGSAAGGGSPLSDALIRTVDVVPTRAVSVRTSSAPLTAGFSIQGGTTGLTTIVLADGGRGRVLSPLLGFAGGGSGTGRFDEALAASMARSLLVDSFAMPATDVPDVPFDPTPYERGGGVALVPYGSPDLELTTLAAYAHDPRLPGDQFVDYLGTVQRDAASTPETQLIALVGRAAAGDADASEIQAAAADPTRSIDEQAWLALGFLAVGDEGRATDLERSILGSVGQRLGPWVRVRSGNDEQTAATTALVGMVAAGIGDPLAADLDAYLDANPPKDTLVDLQRVLAARDWAARTPAADAVASLTVDGAARKLAISPDAPAWISLTPAQLATAKLEPVSGSVVVTTTWQTSLDPSSLQRQGLKDFVRTVTPSGMVKPTDVVVVTYKVTFADKPRDDCWVITDQVPSGLAPIGHPTVIDEGGDSQGSAMGPMSVVGQRVDFCAAPSDPVHSYSYLARVISPGTYTWESPVIQSSTIREWGRTLPAGKVTIAAQ